MIASAVTSRSGVVTPNGRFERSTAVTVSVRISVPKRSDWSRMRVISSLPSTPSGKPG